MVNILMILRSGNNIGIKKEKCYNPIFYQTIQTFLCDFIIKKFDWPYFPIDKYVF